MESDSGNSGNNNGCESMYGGKNPEGTKRWILGEDLAWFVRLAEGQREYLRRRKEKTSGT
jgi:hypothetical protein